MKRKGRQQPTQALHVSLSADGQNIILVDSSGNRNRTVFQASVEELSRLKEELREQAFGIDVPHYHLSGELGILNHLMKLHSKKIIDTRQYNVLSRKAIDIINLKLRPAREFLAKQHVFIADVVTLLPDNYLERSNDELEHIISTLQKLPNDSDFENYNLDTLIELNETLKSFVQKVKISRSTDMQVLLEADIALINCFQQYETYKSYYDSPEESNVEIGNLILNLRRFIKVYAEELYKNDVPPKFMSHELFSKYMTAYAKNDWTERYDILATIGVEPLTLAPGALEGLFVDGIIVDEPLSSDLPSSSASSSSPIKLKPIDFGFLELSSDHPPENSEDDSNPGLSCYEQRKEEGASKHSKKKEYSKLDQEKYLRPSSAIKSRSRNTLTLLEEDLKALRVTPSATDFLSSYSAIADDSSDDEYSSDERSSDEHSGDEYSDDSSINPPKISQPNIQKYISDDSTPASSEDDDYLSSSDDESRSLLTYYQKKKEGADHHLKKAIFKNPKYAAASGARFRR